MKIEHEDERLRAWAYLAALDVRPLKLFASYHAKSGMASFDGLMDQVMTRAPYDEAPTVFWILDNG